MFSHAFNVTKLVNNTTLSVDDVILLYAEWMEDWYIFPVYRAVHSQVVQGNERKIYKKQEINKWNVKRISILGPFLLCGDASKFSRQRKPTIFVDSSWRISFTLLFLQCTVNSITTRILVMCVSQFPSFWNVWPRSKTRCCSNGLGRRRCDVLQNAEGVGRHSRARCSGDNQTRCLQGQHVVTRSRNCCVFVAVTGSLASSVWVPSTTLRSVERDRERRIHYVTGFKFKGRRGMKRR